MTAGVMTSVIKVLKNLQKKTGTIMGEKDKILNKIQEMRQLWGSFYGAEDILDELENFVHHEMYPEPKFIVGDCMRTLEEARLGVTAGLPYVEEIKDGFYRCNNELIPIANQVEYEFPPMSNIRLDGIAETSVKKEPLVSLYGTGVEIYTEDSLKSQFEKGFNCGRIATLMHML